MPGGALGTSEFAPCICKQHGQQPPLGHPYNIISKSTDRRHQVTCPPMGPRTFGKPFLGINSYASPYFHLRNGFHTIHSENSPVKPRIVTVVKPGSHPLRKITLLLNRRSVQTFEQLVADISEALGFPRWKNDRVRKLYSLKGKEIRSVSDFFRGDDAFIALGREQLTMKCIEIVFNELYSDRPFKQNRDHYEKLKSKLNDKCPNADSGSEDIDTANTCGIVQSPRLATKSDGKSQAKIGTEEIRRSKKCGSEACNNEQDKCFGTNKKAANCHGKHSDLQCKISGASLNCIMRCEHCQDHKHKRTFHSEFEKSISFEDTDTIECHRHSLEKEGKSKSGRKSPLRNIQEYEPTVTCKACHNKWRDIDRDYGERKESVNSTLIEKGKSEWQNSRLKNQSENIYRGEQSKGSCIQNKDSREAVSFSKSKPSTRFMEDFIVEPKKHLRSLEEDKGMVVNDCNNNKELLNDFNSTIGKTAGESPEKGEEKVFRLKKPCCIRERMDIESYYEIGRTIGDGNFAVVKECRLRNVNQDFAIKIIDKSKLKGKEDIIENEVRIIKCLSHPNIVKLLDDYETDKEIFLIMEYIKGGDLFDAITESIKFTEQDAALMLTDLCEALVYIHNKNIVHRDLKPENLLVQHNPDGSTTLKLADFGLAVHVTEPIFTVCGTPTYVAPEILSEKGYGLEVDMWATGVILYILLCGFPPFRSLERNQEELFQMVQNGEYEFLSPYWDNISEEAKDLISRLLVLNPKKRYTAKCVLQHKWISSSRQTSGLNLQREITMNIERHFRIRKRKEATETDK
ncbi:serine/threonine-protein kinase DCLK3 [Rhinophrynus dorsalis]